MTRLWSAREWRIEFDQPARLLSMNDRTHWRKLAPMVKRWRGAAMLAALIHAGVDDDRARLFTHQWLTSKIPVPDGWVVPLPACTVRILLPVATRAARDPHNYFKTVKPIVDGLVDARLWPNDTPDWVTTVEPHLVVKAPKVVITLTERTS